jgi:hypothetical protein
MRNVLIAAAAIALMPAAAFAQVTDQGGAPGGMQAPPSSGTTAPSGDMSATPPATAPAGDPSATQAPAGDPSAGSATGATDTSGTTTTTTKTKHKHKPK